MTDGFVHVDQQLDDASIRNEEAFKRVDVQLNNAKIRDEAAHSLLKFSLEAREALRETVEGRFDEVQTKQDQEIGLLQDLLKTVTAAPNRP